MPHPPLLSRSRVRYVGEWLTILFAFLLVAIGLALLVGGAWLASLGGSFYYILAGCALFAAGIVMLAGSPIGVGIYLLTYLFTWGWALWEVGMNGWALVPRIVAPTILAVLALLCLPVLQRGRARDERPAGEPSRSGLGRAIAAAVILAVAAAAALTATAQFGSAQNTRAALIPPANAPATYPAAAGADWPAYGGTNHALRYSTLDQINTGNVARLTRVWTYRTGDLPSEAAKGKYSPETTPIKVGARMYLCTAKNILIGLDAATGREAWRYDPKVADNAIPYGATCRGVVYYRNQAAAEGAACAERIIEGTLDARLIAVDAKDGKPCADFGANGGVDLTKGIGETVPGWYGNVAAPTIVRNVIVMGAQVKDGEAEDAPSGVIRGYDAVTGQFLWAWDMGHPERTTEPPQGDTYTRGTPNMWTSAAGDDALGYVYVPLGNSAVDYYGGNRKDFENEHNSSLVALDVTTGKEVWRFQTVHYDVWDYDLGSQPTLVDIPTKEGSVPAVIISSKQGEIYALDRRTGKSLFPVEEKKAPGGGVEPEKLSPTQPYSSYHSVAKADLKESDMWGMSPLDQMWCRIQFHRAVYHGRYTPPTKDGYFIEYPGYNGGSDWGSVAVDPKNGVLIANYNNMANRDRLLDRSDADRLGLKPITQPHEPPKPGLTEYGAQAGAPYAIEVNPGWRQWTGLMCTQPPYGGITAIDLATGKTLWDEPLGDARANGPFGVPSMLPIRIGTPNNGGPLITAGGIIFIAATTDNVLRAVDIRTGKVLWEDQLPAGGQATPMAFEVNGREYIGFMAGGHHFMETPVGDYVLAYALPST